MSGRKAKRLIGAALLVGASFLFLASLWLLEQRLVLLTRSVVDTNSEASWSLFQTRFELERLLHAIDNAAGSHPDAAQLQTRFDVLWSRIEALRTGSDAAPVRSLPGATALLDRLQAALDHNVQALDPAALPALRTELAQIQ